MTISDKDRLELISYRIKQAEDTIADVELLIENDRFRAAINRIYYGMFYSLLALSLSEKFYSSKHTQLIGWFNKNFIHEGKISERFGKIINKALNRRTKSDYDTFIEFNKETVLEMFDEMKDFIAEIKNFLNI